MFLETVIFDDDLLFGVRFRAIQKQEVYAVLGMLIVPIQLLQISA
jgi:hypothetical protein